MQTLPDHELEAIDPTFKPSKTYQQLLAEGTPEKGGLAQLASSGQTANQPPSTEVQDNPSQPPTSSDQPSVLQQVIRAVASAFGSQPTEAKPDSTAT